MSKQTTIPRKVTVTVTYNPFERHWYRVADFVQTIWHRFSRSRTGRFTTWFVGSVMWLAIRTLLYICAATVIVGCAVLYSGLQFAMGNGKVAKSMLGGK